MKSVRGGLFLAFNLPGGPTRTSAPRQLHTVEKCFRPQSKSVAPPSHRLKQSQAFQDGIIS